MRFTAVLVLTLLGGAARAQTSCQTTPTWSPCEIVVELSDEALKAHPNPVASVDVWG